MVAYYNEIDPYAAQWLRNLIAAGHIADGDVDERSIEDVCPEDLKGYTQCHFFAGIGGWSLALRRAGWPDDRRVWTASCPCQPFSTAGKGNGFSDERHLWPYFLHLVSQCNPSEILGEQVASKAVEPWVDLVQVDLEALGYAFGCIPFPSASVGAPHIRDRIYWVGVALGDTNNAGLSQRERIGRVQREAVGPLPRQTSECGSDIVRMANANSGGLDGVAVIRGFECNGKDSRWTKSGSEPKSCGELGRMADNAGIGRDGRRSSEARSGRDTPRIEPSGLCDVGRLVDAESERRREGGQLGPGPAKRLADAGAISVRASATNGFWRDADWLGCTDGKFRPVEAGILKMVDGIPLRVGLLCATLQTEVEKVTYEAAQRLQTKTREILRTLRETTDSEDIFRSGGGVFSVHEAQVLLAYLLEFAGPERHEQNPIDGAGQKSSPQNDVRMLWRRRAFSDSSCQRELARQPLRELADALRKLSSAVARFAQEAGYKNIYQDAPASYPLGEILYPDSMGVLRPKSRVGCLRAYGNAINVEQAKIWIETVMECLP